jgi:putative peptidoglycan lipid II flippase
MPRTTKPGEELLPAKPPENTGRRHLVSGAARLGFGTFLSRLLGLGRDMTRAWLFGTGMAADAFTVAFRIPNLLRALFPEGALSASLVPILSGFVEKDDLEATNRFLRVMATVLFLALGVVTILGLLVAPLVVPYLMHGFHAVPGKVELTVRLTSPSV